ncbi:MAG TPA: AsmA-like C-terminal region-containing protein, partial [Opitutus sp.]|nr:AsmA-like C-terminal region-containing protein [Opitutus sp.]
RGRIEFDGHRFVARDAVAVVGENEAHGSFEQDLVSREFRFLLDGRLRPLAIGGWFREWWPGFFNNFEFPLAPPNASVDVRGRWGVGHETTVFVFAESMSPLVRGAQLDYARTLIFIRPNFLDGLEVFGTRGAGEVRGAFTRHIELPGYRWREMNIALTSTLDLQTGAKLLGPELGARLQPFVFESPPRVSVAARFDGPGSAAGPRQNMRIEAQSTGAFSFHDFPARNLAFDAVLRDDELTLERVEASVADGTLSGNAKLWGPEGGRRLGFDASLRGASLGLAVTTVSQYAARRRGSESAGAEKILPGKNNVRLDLALSAEGGFDDPFSYRGNGNAALEGAGLGEVRLLGLLSALLDFTALRFTSARAEFKVEGPTIVFPSVNVTGANAAIHAHGDYSLRERQLSFNARIYPFEESNSLLQSVVGAVLTPLSTVLEVKLTGALDDPKWAFVIGPTNLLRSLTQPAAAGNAAVPGAGSAPSPPPTSAAGEKTH